MANDQLMREEQWRFQLPGQSEQTKGIMQGILRQKISERLDKYTEKAGPWQKDWTPRPGESWFQKQTDVIHGMTTKGVPFTEGVLGAANPEASKAYWRMAQAFQAQTGKPLYLTESNRDIEESMRLHPLWLREKAAESFHVTGEGFDVGQWNPSTGLRDYRGLRHEWMRKNAAKYGFHWPGYTKGREMKGDVPSESYFLDPDKLGPKGETYERKPEWWHWNYNPAKAAEGHAAIPEWAKIKPKVAKKPKAGIKTSVGI